MMEKRKKKPPWQRTRDQLAHLLGLSIPEGQARLLLLIEIPGDRVHLQLPTPEASGVEARDLDPILPAVAVGAAATHLILAPVHHGPTPLEVEVTHPTREVGVLGLIPLEVGRILPTREVDPIRTALDHTQVGAVLMTVARTLTGAEVEVTIVTNNNIMNLLLCWQKKDKKYYQL